MDDLIGCARAVGEGVSEWSEFARVLLRGCETFADGARGDVARVGLSEGDRRANRRDGCFAVAIEGARGVHTRPHPDRSQIVDAERPVLVPRDSACTRARVGSSFRALVRYCIIRHVAHT